MKGYVSTERIVVSMIVSVLSTAITIAVAYTLIEPHHLPVFMDNALLLIVALSSSADMFLVYYNGIKKQALKSDNVFLTVGLYIVFGFIITVLIRFLLFISHLFDHATLRLLYVIVEAVMNVCFVYVSGISITRTPEEEAELKKYIEEQKRLREEYENKK